MVELENLNPWRYNRFMRRKRAMYDARANKTYANIPKKKRIGAVLDDFPKSTWKEIKSLTNLDKATIQTWFVENGIDEYALPPDVDENLLDDLFLYGITTDDLRGLSRYKLWVKLGKCCHLTPALDNALSYINSFYDKG